VNEPVVSPINVTAPPGFNLLANPTVIVLGFAHVGAEVPPAEIKILF
jgi:hypothetical protein